MKIEGKNKIYLTSGIFAGLALLMIIVCIFLFNGIIKNSNDLNFKKNEAAVLEKEFSDINKFKKDYTSYQQNLAKIDQLFINSQNPVDFIEFLEETAYDHGLKLDVSVPSFTAGSVIAGDFQISLSGDYFSKIFGFIKDVENGPYLVQIKNLNITKSQELNKTNQLKASISMQVLAK